jgi:aspartate 4-decarboxylase
VVRINASERDKDGTPTWQYPDSEIDKLADRSVKAFFVVNPSNPPSVAMRPSTVKRLVRLVKTRHPDLMIITDDVYATFVNGFRSLMAELPQNTIGVYSYSKYFGATGWRLGVVAVHEKNLFDRMIAELPAAQSRQLNRRYSNISLRPERLKFIDRMVADSRQVALNHTAGLSLPQQVQMALFSAFALVDKENAYKRLTQRIVQRRLKALWGGMELPLPEDELRAGYYTELDLKAWARNQYGPGFVKFLTRNYEPLDILFRLAEQASIVLLNGGGFEAPKWSLRISLANLPEEAYAKIGEYLRGAVQEYVGEWKKSLKGK